MTAFIYVNQEYINTDRIDRFMPSTRNPGGTLIQFRTSATGYSYIEHESSPDIVLAEIQNAQREVRSLV